MKMSENTGQLQKSDSFVTAPTPHNQQYRIFVKNLILQGRIGIFPEEKTKPQAVGISIEFLMHRKCNATSPKSIDDTVCYITAVRDIKSLVEKKHIDLVEILAERIATLCLSYNHVDAVQVTVEKPEAINAAETAGVTITRTREKP